MKAFYDSEADALAVHFTDPIRGGYAEDLEGVEDVCWVEIDDKGEKVGVELLYASEYFHLLDTAATQYGLDPGAVKAAAAAAMVVPMRYVRVEVAEEVAEEELLAA